MKLQKKIKVDKSTWDKVRIICHIKGTSMTNMIDKLFREFVRVNYDSIERFNIRTYLNNKKEVKTSSE